MHMNTPSTEITISGRVGLYEPFQVMNMWEDAGDSSPNTNTGGSTHRSWFDSMVPSRDEQGKKPYEKVKRRLAQNREAARKSRLRKKAYVQQLESSRLKLAQIEQDLARARQEGLYVTGIGAFEMEYSHWIEEQQRHSCQLREALQSDTSPTQVRNLVETVLNHYYSLFRMKAEAARADVFYLLSGLWRSSAERFFLWIGGSRPSDLLQVLMPHFDPLTDQQMVSVSNLRHSSQQAEDALSQGMDKLQQTLSQSMAYDSILVGPHMEDAMEQLETMESFVNQADHLRQQTLQQMSRILTTRQAARGLLGLGEYFHRLAALSSLWAARPRQPT